MRLRFCPPRGPGSFWAEIRVFWKRRWGSHRGTEKATWQGGGDTARQQSPDPSLTSSPHPSSPLEAERFWRALPLPPTKRRWLPDLPPDGLGQAEGAGSSGRGDCSPQGRGRGQETWNAGFHLPLPVRQREGIQAACLPGRAVVMGPDASVSSWRSEGHGPSLPCLAWMLAGGRSCPSIQVGIAGDSPTHVCPWVVRVVLKDASLLWFPCPPPPVPSSCSRPCDCLSSFCSFWHL